MSIFTSGLLSQIGSLTKDIREAITVGAVKISEG